MGGVALDLRVLPSTQKQHGADDCNDHDQRHGAWLVFVRHSHLPQAVFVFSGLSVLCRESLKKQPVIDGCTPFMAFWRIVFRC